MSVREQYMSVPGLVDSGGRYPPSFAARALRVRGKNFGYPAVSISLHPPFSHQPVGVSPLRLAASPRSTSPSALHWWRQGGGGLPPHAEQGEVARGGEHVGSGRLCEAFHLRLHGALEGGAGFAAEFVGLEGGELIDDAG